MIDLNITLIINIRYNVNVYANDSMDRLGDDLTEEVLQYLTLEDKIKLECVSEQWKRCVYNKQYVITIDNFYVRKNLLNKLNDNYKLESVLKKCQNIVKVIIRPNIRPEVKSEVLSLIGRYCHCIKSLTYCPTFGRDDNVLSFFRIYGHKLEELNINGWNSDVNNLLQFCPNVKKAYFSDFSVVLNEDKEFLPKLVYSLSRIWIFEEEKMNSRFLPISTDRL